MADIEDMVLATIRRHIADRRQAIALKFPKNLAPEEYLKHVGRHEELEALATVVQDAVRRANAQDLGIPDESDPETA
jgi:hypothetical protein